jgi:hypothetical protein
MYGPEAGLEGKFVGSIAFIKDSCHEESKIVPYTLHTSRQHDR